MESHRKRYEIHGLEHKDMPVIFWASGRGTVPNWHENIEMLYCTKGKGQLFCGGEEYLMVPGHIYVINASELHSAFDLGQLNYYCLIVDANFLSQNSLKTAGLELETDVIRRTLWWTWTWSRMAIFCAKARLGNTNTRSSELRNAG